MTDPLRSALQSAIAFARVFIDAAEDELIGSPSFLRIIAANQLYAALENIEVIEEEES